MKESFPKSYPIKPEVPSELSGSKLNSALSKCLERNHFITVFNFLWSITERKTFCGPMLERGMSGDLNTSTHPASKSESICWIDGLVWEFLKKQAILRITLKKRTFTYQAGDKVLFLYTTESLRPRIIRETIRFWTIRTLLIEVYHEHNFKRNPNAKFSSIRFIIR